MSHSITCLCFHPYQKRNTRKENHQQTLVKPRITTINTHINNGIKKPVAHVASRSIIPPHTAKKRKKRDPHRDQTATDLFGSTNHPMWTNNPEASYTAIITTSLSHRSKNRNPKQILIRLFIFCSIFLLKTHTRSLSHT